jgi:hypothetical protein
MRRTRRTRRTRRRETKRRTRGKRKGEEYLLELTALLGEEANELYHRGVDRGIVAVQGLQLG